jgi:hypothetical protein
MTYATESAKFGRIPTVFVELDMDFCSLRSGIGACMATQTGDAKCYNTYSTCNDTAHFDKITKTYLFSEQNADLPIGLSTIPLLKSVNFASQEITPGKGLGVRGSVTAKFLDAPFPDTEIDPYWSERTYDTINSGTFWGKFKARNPYYENRVLRVRRGYLTAVFDWGNFVDSVYVIDRLDGISKNDDVTVAAKDILKLADDKKALFPRPFVGQLSADINTSATSITLAPAGIGITYSYDGKVSISGEVMSFTRSGDVLTVTRAQSNTIAAAHTTGDTVQQVGIFTNEKIHDVIYTLLTNAGINCSLYVDYSDWNTEATDYLAGVWSAEITEPTGINTLLGELTEQGLCRIWWDELDQQIKFRAVKQLPSGLSTLTDSSNFLTKSIDVKTDTAQRLSTVLVYFAQKKPTEKLDDLKNYELRVATSDTDASGALKYGTNPIKKIFSRWFKKTSLGRVNALSDSLLKTYLNPPRIIEFNLTPALQLKVGDLFYANTRKIQGLTGANINVPMEVVYAQPTDKDDIKYKAQEVSTAIPLSNTYTIYISDDEDVNLYDYFVDEFGVPEEGITVNFVVLAGSLITGSTTANYALTNPDTWPSDCTLTLEIEVGAVVAGLGGKGGDGASIFTGYSTPSSAGTKGGNSILVESALSITNFGTIGTGGGGGGGGGFTIVRILGDLDIYEANTSGGGGGGGAGIGEAGETGEFLGTSAPNGTNGGNSIGGAGADGVSGTSSGGAGNGHDSRGGKGGDLNEDGERGYGDGSGSAWSSGGAHGDYAVNGDTFITWIATGTRYGTIV